MGLGAWLRKYRQVEQLEKELAEWKSRALRAEEAWHDRQKEIMGLSMDLRNEKAKVQSIEAAILGQMIKLIQNASKRFMKKYGISIQYALRKDERKRLYLGSAILAMNSTTIIDAFAAMFHTDKATLLAKLGQAQEIMQKIEDRMIPPTTFLDDYADMGGRLYPQSHCGMCRGGYAKKREGDKP